MFPTFFIFNFTNFLYILPTIILVILSRYIIKTYRRDPRLVQFAQTIPGPPETSIFGSSADLFYGEDSINKLIKYAEKYGDTYKLWFGRYLVVGLSKVEDISAVYMGSKTNEKTDLFLKPFGDYWGNGLFTNPTSIWKINRKKLLPAYASNRFKQYTFDINDKTSNVLKVMEKQVNGSEFDIKEYTTYLSFDVITKLLFNVELEWDNQLAKTFHHSTMKAIVLGFKRMCLPWFHMKFLSYLYYGKQAKEIFAGTRGLTKKILNEKMSQINNEIRLHKENPDKLPIDQIPPKLFLTYAYELLDNGYDESVIHDEIITAITGGTDTTGTALAFLFLAIAIHQDIQAKLYDEIYEVFGDNDDRYADQEDIKRLPYLEQVIKESLRRFTIVPFILKNVSEDAKIGDRIFPAGTVILIPIAAVHLNPKYYPNPWQFNPENFNPEVVEKRPKHAFIPFSAGARNCIGKNLALHDMKLIAIAFLRKYSLHTTVTMNDIKLNCAFTIRSANGHNVSLKYRIKKPSYLLND